MSKPLVQWTNENKLRTGEGPTKSEKKYCICIRGTINGTRTYIPPNASPKAII